jgi:hypothetical protein
MRTRAIGVLATLAALIFVRAIVPLPNSTAIVFAENRIAFKILILLIK